jgi:hypothetical protein
MWTFIKELFGFHDKKETEVATKKDTRREEIVELYHTILGREPDKDGLDWWVNSQATIEEIKSEFLKSPEVAMKSRMEQITKLYQEVLGRDPDVEGLKFWAEGPLQVEEIRVELMKSEEYLSKITPVQETPKPTQATKSNAKTVAKGRPKKTK